MKTLVKEVQFGKAMAHVTVTAFAQKVYSDGIDTGKTELITTSEVKVMKDGKMIDKAYFAKVSGYDANPKWFNQMGLNNDQKISRVGEKAITLGAEAGQAVNAEIKEMKEELAKEFGMKTEDQIQKTEEKVEVTEEAKAIVEQAQTEGVNNLMTDSQLKKWRVNYNNLHNEGGEGYIPIRISKEQYQRSLNILEGSKI